MRRLSAAHAGARRQRGRGPFLPTFVVLNKYAINSTTKKASTERDYRETSARRCRGAQPGARRPAPGTHSTSTRSTAGYLHPLGLAVQLRTLGVFGQTQLRHLRLLAGLLRHHRHRVGSWGTPNLARGLNGNRAAAAGTWDGSCFLRCRGTGSSPCSISSTRTSR